MKCYNVLVTGTSSYGVGEGLIKIISLSRYRNSIRLIVASNSDLIAYKDLADKYYVLPSAKSNIYLEALMELIIREKIDVLIPGSEAEMEVISRNKCHFKDVDAWVNDYNLIKLFNNKSNANEFLSKNNIYVPCTFEKIEEDKLKYPLIIKPTQGKSSENIYVARNATQLESVINLFKSYNRKFIIQEYIEEGEEYTISLINLNNKDVKVLIMKRILCKGATQYAYIEENYIIKEIALKIHNLIKNELIINIQILKKDDKYFVLEINPRFSGSSPMRAMLGFNEFDIIFSFKYLKQNFQYNLIKNKFAIRGYKEFSYVKK
ncbi:ATP-grasp domain-containing protein [Clostridium lundense]|uniref:ATP-grasp domain-containing protein n=1 Tax=Clostridium lundense TaxID=319475 RepID=UPI000483EEC7|nr:ATP-grasp domain-containing protein [Clostridium lundense]